MSREEPENSVVSERNQRQITILILSYERHSFLRRQLLYYAGHPVHVVLADGSAVAWRDGLFGSSGDMTWEYVHLPGYDSYRERLSLACERVGTDYVCLVDDQECILWTGLQSAIRTLDANPDHVCAGGLVALASKTRRGMILVPWGHRGEPWALTDPSQMARFRKVTGPEQHSVNLYYQVTRTTILRNFAQAMKKFEGISLITTEVALAGYLALAGKWAMGNYPYWIRAGNSVSAPEAPVVIIPPQEITDICSKLLEMRARDSDGGKEVDENYERESLHEAIEHGWGESSLWAISSQKYVDGLRPLSERGKFQRSVLKARSRVYELIRESAPGLHRRLRPESLLAIGPVLGFLDYARTHAPGRLDVATDLMTLSAIWENFPNGMNERALAPPGI